jgi:hypothetical protein
VRFHRENSVWRIGLATGRVSARVVVVGVVVEVVLYRNLAKIAARIPLRCLNPLHLRTERGEAK